MYSITGKDIYPEMEILIWYDEEDKFLNQIHEREYFRLILIEKGAGIMSIGSKRILFSAPSIFCISEDEIPILEQNSEISAKSLYFHPNVINSNLDFKNIRDDISEMSPTMKNECTSLHAFFIRSDSYNGYMSIGILTAKRIAFLLEELNNELNDQKDGFWPCRSRSFFLELLFCVQRVYFQRNDLDNSTLQEKSNEIDGVLLYLHSNYDKKVTIDDLTKKFNMNRTTLNKKFNQLTNMSVMAYLINYRIKLAAMILRDTQLPVSEVIERVGFIDSAHFSRLFKKNMNCSPTDYRQNFPSYMY